MVNFVHFNSWLWLSVLEIILIYINFKARINYEEFCYEANPIWRKFDASGKALLSMYIHPILVMGVWLYGVLYEDGYFLGFLVGFLMLNVIIDFRNFRDMKYCLNKGCKTLDNRKICIQCRKDRMDKK